MTQGIDNIWQAGARTQELRPSSSNTTTGAITKVLAMSRPTTYIWEGILKYYKEERRSKARH